MAESGVVVRVPTAEATVGALRERFDASAALGMPAHVTVLFPFMAPARIDAAVLARIERALRTVPAFRFSLATVGRFPATAYLAPEPASPFIELTRALVREFPDHPPFRGAFGTIVPHLTVANGDAAEAAMAEAELRTTMAAHGPIDAVCDAVVLVENASGVWKPLRVFDLRKS